jgi:hypothetical protein
MAKKSKKERSGPSGIKHLITVDPSLPSFEDHPYFKKKAAAAKALLEKVGLPKGLSKKSQS